MSIFVTGSKPFLFLDLLFSLNFPLNLTKYNLFMKTKCRISQKIGIYKMPIEMSYNIDNAEDLLKTEQMIKRLKNNDKLFSVKNKNIILTGSSGLLGSHYARVLLERGVNIALIDHSIKNSQLIKKEFSHTGQNIQVYKCNLEHPKEILKHIPLISGRNHLK